MHETRCVKVEAEVDQNLKKLTSVFTAKCYRECRQEVVNVSVCMWLGQHCTRCFIAYYIVAPENPGNKLHQMLLSSTVTQVSVQIALNVFCMYTKMAAIIRFFMIIIRCKLVKTSFLTLWR